VSSNSSDVFRIAGAVGTPVVERTGSVITDEKATLKVVQVSV
jgi:hypothetical protein